MTWIRFGVWTIIGIIVYLGYGVKHSRLAGEPLQPHLAAPSEQ
ncbi:MAG TPA: amino acid permease C-terminal domain-containing protein [Nitrospira sp.]|nr:amino acid permease C-terminal domain-containing protein [Nitrospira sp.]